MRCTCLGCTCLEREAGRGGAQNGVHDEAQAKKAALVVRASADFGDVRSGRSLGNIVQAIGTMKLVLPL